MNWIVELPVLFLVFTLMVMPSVLKNPLSADQRFCVKDRTASYT